MTPDQIAKDLEILRKAIAELRAEVKRLQAMLPKITLATPLSWPYNETNLPEPKPRLDISPYHPPHPTTTTPVEFNT